jgi:hypothetical protein
MNAEPEAKPVATFHLDRPSARSPEERRAHFDNWWSKLGEPYQAAVIEHGDTPWTADLDERRELFLRRYERPAAPATAPIKNLAEIRRSA